MQRVEGGQIEKKDTRGMYIGPGTRELNKENQILKSFSVLRETVSTSQHKQPSSCKVLSLGQQND